MIHTSNMREACVLGKGFVTGCDSHSDDDAYLNTPVANLGEIKIEIWVCKILGEATSTSVRIDPIASSNVKVHERSKKVGTHRIQYVFG
jgi:hypothetical protein